MTKIKQVLLKICLRLLDSSFEIDYKKINKRAVEDWAYKSFSDPGWRSYFAYEDLRLLKDIARGHEPREYFVLVGRRVALLNLFNEMRKAVENKKSRQEKENAEQKKANRRG